MRFPKLLQAAALAFAPIVASEAKAATTIDFNNICRDHLETPHGLVYSVGPLTFTNNSSNPNISATSQFSWSRDEKQNADGANGGCTLSQNVATSTTTVTRTDGGIFDLTSIDIAPVLNNLRSSQTGDVTFNFNGVNKIVTLDGIAGLQTVFFNENNLTSFSYTGGDHNLSLQVDNFVGDFAKSASPISPVPEPATWTMMIAGFGLLGASMRRQKHRSLDVA